MRWAHWEGNSEARREGEDMHKGAKKGFSD